MVTSSGRSPRVSGRRDRNPIVRQGGLHELREARKELKGADHDFNGRRAEAIKAIDHAIEQLEKALKTDKK